MVVAEQKTGFGEVKVQLGGVEAEAAGLITVGVGRHLVLGSSVAVQAVAVVTAALFIAVSLITDLLALWLNPRLRSAP